MKKNIGKTIGLYPSVLVVVGAIVENKPSFTLVGHLGIIGHDRIMISLVANHYINQGIKENKNLSVNLVDENMLPKADYVGSVSGKNVDKSEVFTITKTDLNVPLIDESPLSMECELDSIMSSNGFDNFILKINATYVKEEYLTNNKIDYQKIKPILFAMPSYEYLKTGEVWGKCLSFSPKKEKNE